MDSYFERKIGSIIENVYQKKTSYLTHFLNVLEQEKVQEITKHYPQLRVAFFGGFPEAEYTKAAIGFDLDEFNWEVTILKLTFNPQYLQLTHRKLLGILMSLGINRDRIGDLVLTEGVAYIAASDEVVSFLISNVTMIHNQKVELIPTDGQITFVDQGKARTIFVKSNRLDAVLASSLGIARHLAVDLIEGKFVRINQKFILKSTQSVAPGDVISIEHKGRVKIDGDFLESQSGRIKMQVKIYR